VPVQRDEDRVDGDGQDGDLNEVAFADRFIQLCQPIPQETSPVRGFVIIGLLSFRFISSFHFISFHRLRFIGCDGEME